jgi:cytochrome c oxidase subunit 2
MPFRHEFGTVLLFEAIIAAVVFACVVGTLAFAVVRYRAGRRAEASQETEHKRLEIWFACVVFAVAVTVVTVTARANARDYPPGNAAMQVDVTGFQWCWKFHYVQSDITTSADCADGAYPVLLLPVGERIHITTTSEDVIHSFWIPAFDYKMDAFPHHLNNFDITIPHTGEWLGHCAELCGLGHAQMEFYVRGVSASDFTAWTTANAGTFVTTPPGGSSPSPSTAVSARPPVVQSAGTLPSVPPVSSAAPTPVTSPPAPKRVSPSAVLTPTATATVSPSAALSSSSLKALP